MTLFSGRQNRQLCLLHLFPNSRMILLPPDRVLKSKQLFVTKAADVSEC